MARRADGDGPTARRKSARRSATSSARQPRSVGSALKKSYAAERGRLTEGQAALQAGLTGAAAQLRAYGVFEDALRVAGFARALGKPAEEVQSLLAVAAQAALVLFHSRGTLTRTRTALPVLEDEDEGDVETEGVETEDVEAEAEEFVDTSATNPWTFVRALYAALAAGQPDLERKLAALSPADYETEQVRLSEVAAHYVAALHRAAAGRPEAALSELRTALASAPASPSAAQTYWVAQARALNKALQQEKAAFQAALSDLEDASQAYYAGERFRNDPARLLSLPVLGLAALGKRLGLTESP